ncbi:MAG: FkbM family methyltransferase [Anaerolineae bacterium]|nr:FkbM family methyltransferase [Anaerolineae bacterium]
MSELDIYGPHITGGKLAVDVGASQGEFTFKFAEKYKRVIAYEPLPAARQIMAARVMPDNVEVRPTAVWSSCGRLTLYAHSWDKLTGIHKTHPQWPSISDMPFDVKAVSLDSDLRSQVPDLIKIDTEGAETRIIDGAMDTIERCRPKLMIELHHKMSWKIIQKRLAQFSYIWKTWPSPDGEPNPLKVKHMVGVV